MRFIPSNGIGNGRDMIGKLRGLADAVGTETAIIDVGGVGYVVYCSAPTLAALKPGEPASVYVETILREDMLRLYGFATAIELEWFRLLQSVQGVGAKMALAILATLSGGEIAGAIASGDAKTLSRANGVGPRLGARIAAELKGKVPDGLVDAALGPAPSGSDAPEVLEATSALTNLGYPRPQALAALREVAAAMDAPTVQVLVRQGLKRLSAR